MKVYFKLRPQTEMLKNGITHEAIKKLPFELFLNKEFIANYFDSDSDIVIVINNVAYHVPHNMCKYIRLERE